METFEVINHNELKKKIKTSEQTRREMIVEKIKQISDEYAVEPVIEGSVISKMVIRLTPRPSTGSNDKRALKEERKRLRMEKLQKRIEKKRERNNAD